jgi:hypothetical protein
VDEVVLLATPDAGWRFAGWSGVDSSDGVDAVVSLVSNRMVTATFVAATAPSVTNLAITLDEDTVSDPFAPVITDADPEDAHTLSVVTPPTHGVVTVGLESFVYTPDENFNGADSFTYQVTDQYGLMLAEPATADIQVNPVNDPPQVQSVVTVALGPGQHGPILPAVSDPDEGDSVTFSIVTQPANGTASADANGLYYTPETGFSWLDTFTFRATDSAGASDTGTAQIDVLSEPTIGEAGVGGGQFNFTVGPLPEGVGYTVEYKDEMNDLEWLPVPPPEQWPSTNATFTDGVEQSERYYRLRFEFLIQ